MCTCPSSLQLSVTNIADASNRLCVLADHVIMKMATGNDNDNGNDNEKDNGSGNDNGSDNALALDTDNDKHPACDLAQGPSHKSMTNAHDSPGHEDKCQEQC